MTCILFSRPNHDVVVSYLHYHSKKLVDLSNSKRYKTINKESKDATKTNIVRIIKQHKPDFIMFNGHGSPKTICGHKNEVIISSDDNPEVLSSTITYSLSCASGLELGKIAVDRGAICFIGYELDFALGKDPDSEATPPKDKIATLFLEPSNILVNSLLKGNTVEMAIKKAKDKMMENVWYLRTTKAFSEAPYYAPFLFANYIGLVAYGNENSRIN